MADTFFGFNTSLGGGLEDALDSSLEDEEYGDEDKYDALNDETFGSEATTADWEQDHEKLAQITESSRPHVKNGDVTNTKYENNVSNDIHNNSVFDKDNEVEIDVENTLSHLVIDDKEITVPKPGVWDSPTNLLPLSKPSLSATLKNACTVEELERNLLTNRPPPGLTKPAQQQIQSALPPGTNSANLFFNSSQSDKIQQLNGTGPSPLNQFHYLRLPSPHFPPHLQNVRPLPNQPGGMLPRFPMPSPLLFPPGAQRPFHHNNFPMNFPHPPSNHHPAMGPVPFLRPDHPFMQHFNVNNHQSMHQNNMMAGNQRIQNRYDHMFFKNNQYMHNQNYPQNHLQHNHHNQEYHQNQRLHSSEEHDDYAGLMNTREKNWLNNIQLLQLNTNQPYIDDFYFTVFCERSTQNRHKAKSSDSQYSDNSQDAINRRNKNSKMDVNVSLKENSRDSRDRDQPQQTFNKTNTPMQFENSLGKLQYSSVTAPRKIIDMDVVSNNDAQQPQSGNQKDTKRTRQLLLEIERLYIILLKLEDTNNPLAILAEFQRVQQQREQLQQRKEAGEEVEDIVPRDPVKYKEEFTLTIFNSLIQFIKEDKFASLLSIRKGKTLFLRFLSCLNVKDYETQLVHLWAGVIRGLVIIGRRDSHFLTNFYTEFRKLIIDNHLNLMLLLDLVKSFMYFTAGETQGSHLKFSLTNKFGISVISLMIRHAENIFAENDAAIFKWTDFIKAIGECIVSIQPVVAPCELIDANVLSQHLVRNNVDESICEAFELYFTSANPSR